MPISLPPLSRRQFLKRTLAASALVAARPFAVFADSKSLGDNFALMADTHIAADPKTISRHSNMSEHLATVLEEVGAEHDALTQAIIGGDCAFVRGEPGDYVQFLKLLEPARKKGLTFHLALGNHDHRQHCLAKAGAYFTDEQPVEGRLVTILLGKSANWFILDSLERTLLTPGTLGEAQLKWLGRALDEHKDRPAIVVLHHNLDLGTKIVGLTDTAALLDVLRPRQHVKACVYGHTHYWRVGRDPSGIHVINLPPVAYVFQEGRPYGWVRTAVEPDALHLELRCIDHEHPLHASTHHLEWR